MDEAHLELWRRLEALELDDPAASFPFSTRLARENGWSLRHAQRVIGEYKRFLFLTAVSPTRWNPTSAPRCNKFLSPTLSTTAKPKPPFG